MTQSPWLAARREVFTSTDTSKILGLNPFGSGFEVWGEKTGRIEPADLSDNEAVEFGIEFEPVVGKIYLRRTKRRALSQDEIEALDCRVEWHKHVDFGEGEVVKLFLRHKTIDWLGASPDLIVHHWTLLPDVGEQVERAGHGISEIKTTSVFAAKKNYEEDDEGNWVAPQWVQCQLQQQLLVSGLSWGCVPCVVGGQKLLLADYGTSPEIQDMMINELTEFREQFLLKDRPPPVDGSARTTKAIMKVFSHRNGETMVLRDEFRALDVERQEIMLRRKMDKERKEEIDNQIKLAIGEYSVGALPGVCTYVISHRERDAYTVPAGEWDQMDRRKNKGT